MLRLLWLIPSLLAAADDGHEFFEKKIRPVLAAKCYSCHSGQTKTPMAGLRLDTAAGTAKALAGGTGSQLLKAIRYSDLNLRMPPSGKLPAAEIADFERWAAMGAPDPRKDEAATADRGIDWAEARKHWAFRPVVKPTPPSVREAAWVRTPVDAFLLAKLEEKGLKPAPQASRRDWLRRVTFDLTGLPPSGSEIDEFLNDATQQAEKKVVDRLLASPHYGERWARHWLDLVRFAETNGHEFDNDKLDAWRYRDYVIRAFNEDVPYNQFVKEHIAGDLLPAKRLSSDGAHWESPLGTAVYWFGEVLNSATDSVKSRADTVDNQIDVLSKAFLGLTVSCARCHDHKFDPIPTVDYYGLAGIMHSTRVREVVVDSPARVREIASLRQRISDIHARTPQPSKAGSFILREGDILFEDFEGLDFDGWTVTGQAFGTAPVGAADSFAGGTKKLVGSLTSKTFKMPKLWVHIRMKGTALPPALKENNPLRVTVVADDHKSEHYLPTGKPEFEWKSIRMTKEIGRACYFEIVDRSPDGFIAVDKIVISDHREPPAVQTPEVAADPPALTAEQQAEIERLEQKVPPSAFAMLSKDEDPRDIPLHIRGSHQNLGAPVPRHFLQFIAGERQPPVSNGSGRLELAEWVGGGKNPLTARVMVNRMWKHHFGSGIVRSTDNFGRLGEAPSHPELVDWLAAEFVERGWSVKEMHRLMVLSSAYRMSGDAQAEALKADPRNTLLHHMPVRRLEAEAIRDSILSVAGKLDRAMYGPGVTPHISKYQEGRGKPKSGPLDGNRRRSIYIQVRRNFLTPMFLAFDYPLPVSTIGARGVSTVPSQALMMMNNEFVAQQAANWATRAIATGQDAARRVHGLFVDAYGRPPEEWETRESLGFVSSRPGGERQAWTDLCHVLLNSAEFVYVR
ncbi:MAG: PSD1 and planctomycete cytochrome C domain-containing protein [Bryobacteraceae bacterium]|nr:PSD1 and planctomycete cytochrome C domain-containing protein [Bryobacteraceae bacterium]